ncbi:MAG TPA: MarR family transcriptional regulator [Propionibacteriaceae bacterium]|nr:MarR family transcriptional regulator [Propionibacteriaceae bacterium]HPZ48682.1 MarR family transcriptional regulator [Propionibacteriaceae bacterium]HQE31129.1 MarR family transcriptional regulator [Propionibacteriaceae bacterium]
MTNPDRRDEVDEIVAAWRRERPDLPTEPLEVLSRVKRVAQQLDHGRRTAFAAHDLQLWEFDVLAALRRSGEPYQLSPGQLVRQNHVTSGTMTNRVDRLAARGLVERSTDPSDGRGVLVRLTTTGMELVDAALADLLVWEDAQLAGLGGSDRSELATLLRRLLLAVAT